MEKERKTRKPPVWDPIKRLTRKYRAQVKDAHHEIDQCAKTGRSTKVITLNYARDVIYPISKELKEKLPDQNLSVSEKVEKFGTNDGYFKVSSGELIIGGFSYPGPGVCHINFTVFAHGKPWGKAIEIKKLSQLSKVITDLLKFLGSCNYDSDED